MQFAINTLRKERENIVSALKEGKTDRLRDLQEIDSAIGWLEALRQKEVDRAPKYDFVTLPVPEGGNHFVNYRICLDNETDDRKYWEEFRAVDGDHYRLGYGDYLLIHKPY